MKRPMQSIVFTAALAALFTFGCQPAADGDGDAGPVEPGTDGGAPLPDDARAQLVDATSAYICAFVRTCRHFSDDLNVAHGLDTAGGDCEAFFARDPRLFRAAFEPDATIDVAAFERCAARSLETCAPLDDFAACEDVVIGARAEGEGCDDAEACGPGLYCDSDAGDVDAGQCADICVPTLAPGAPCRGDAECAAVGEQRGVCHDGACAALTVRDGAGLGEPCGLLDEAGAPVRATCAAGHYCPAGPGGRGTDTCAAIPTLGEPCDDFDVPCADGVCGFEGVCVPWDVRTAGGDPCSPLELQLCGGMHGLACVAGVCRETDGAEGEPCLDEPVFGGGCRRGHFCDDGLCVRALADGEACTDDDGWRCDSRMCGEDSTCTPTPAPCR